VKMQALGEICEFKYGKSLPNSKRKPGDIPVYGSNGLVGFHNESYLDGKSIIIGRKGSIGKIHLSNSSCWPIDTTYYINEKDIDVDIRWLAYLLGYLNLDKMNRAAAIPGLNRNDAYKLEVAVPKISETSRVANILDKAKELKDKRQQAINKINELTQSIFLDMFGDPVTNPKGWKVLPFDQMGNLDRGVSKHRPRNDPRLLGGNHPLIQTGDVANSGGYVKNYKSTYSDLGLKQSKKWPKGTLCITIAANIAKTGILTFDACFPDSVVGFTSSPHMVEYVRVWLSFLQKTLERNAPESAQKNINLRILRDLPVPRPPENLIESFHTRISTMSSALVKMQVAQKTTETLFQSLQSRAFKGEL
jgi:type I restriction enzyme S subunit